MLTLDIMKTQWIHGDQHVPGLTEAIVTAAPAVFAHYGLATPLVVAHAMAQFSEECGAGLEMVENLNYSAAGLRATWPARFTGSMAGRLAHNPRLIADVAYGGRMGNAPPPSDDGWTFRGRGLSQVTGREGYERLGAELVKAGVNIDPVDDPDAVCEPAHALLCGVADFILCGCLPHAERDDVVGVTRALNGGLIGLAARRAWLRRWKLALGVTAAAA